MREARVDELRGTGRANRRSRRRRREAAEAWACGRSGTGVHALRHRAVSAHAEGATMIPTPCHAALPSIPTRPCRSPRAADPTHRPTTSTRHAERPSKTRRKRESHELQALGEALLELRATTTSRRSASTSRCVDALARLPRASRSHEARRRQMQLIGKLMRRPTSSCAARRGRRAPARPRPRLARAAPGRALARRADRRRRRRSTRFARRARRRRPAALRALVRNARKDAGRARPSSASGRAYRELFQFIREHASR